MDFTITKYQELLNALINEEYNFETFESFLKKPLPRTIILRHDVDLLPDNSLQFAEIQADLGIKGTYYFRAVPESWDANIILKIAKMGHEIGYHYESLTTCNGDMSAALTDFENNLKKLRLLAPVNTICMHGSPLSAYDSKALWDVANYKDFGLLGEPYFDMDFTTVFYLTDTGRRWDGQKVSVRDKVEQNLSHKFHSTNSIITSAQNGLLPEQIMFTFHPQRWSNHPIRWSTELVLQNTKNIVKRYFYVPMHG